MPKMAWNRSALHDVLAQGASNRDITVHLFFVIFWFPQNESTYKAQTVKHISESD